MTVGREAVVGARSSVFRDLPPAMICHGTPCRPCVRADGSAHEDLIYGINYAPELTGIGKYSAEMAEWLAARGHSVSVVTAPPYYPQWRVHDGYRAGRYAREERAGVSVRRAVVGAGAARWRQAPAAPGQLRPVQPSQPAARRRRAADVILVVEPALFCAPAAWLAARLCGARAWLHVQDYEVDAAFELGLLRAPGCAAPSPAPSAG